MPTHSQDTYSCRCTVRSMLPATVSTAVHCRMPPTSASGGGRGGQIPLAYTTLVHVENGVIPNNKWQPRAGKLSLKVSPHEHALSSESCVWCTVYGILCIIHTYIQQYHTYNGYCFVLGRSRKEWPSGLMSYRVFQNLNTDGECLGFKSA